MPQNWRPSFISGELDLQKLLENLQTKLDPDIWVYTSFSKSEDIPSVDAKMVFEEAEGKTLIIKLSEAEEKHIVYEYPCQMITLKIHSSLAAVGFLAVVTDALAKKGISVNPVSGYFHDHLFVPTDRTDDALLVLKMLG